MRFVVVCVAVAVVTLGCSGPMPYRSNFASVKLTPTLVTSHDGKPYTGTLTALDREIHEVARLVLASPTLEAVLHVDPSGLILVLPIRNGVPEGRARVLVNLRAKTLSKAIAHDPRLAVATAAVPTIQIAEAGFVAGKLDGTATVLGPSADRRGTVKLAEVTFRGGELHGPVTEYHRGSAQRKRTFTFSHGLTDGEEVEYYLDGARRARRTYAMDRPIGTHEAWFPNGQKRRVTVYADDAEPQTTEWYSNGQLASSPPDGVVEEFHPSGARASRTHYTAGVKHGAYEAWYADGRPWKTGAYVEGALDGPYREWWTNGKPATEAVYARGALTGSYRRWYANGQLWEQATYEVGKRVGPYRKWWKNGKPAHVYAYVDGKLDGEYRQLYDNGAKWVEARYERGKPKGTIQRWFPDGRLGYVLEHEGGRPHGRYERWWPDGKPRLIARYDRGKFDGELKNWLEDGTMYEQAVYRSGTQISSTRAGADPRD